MMNIKKFYLDLPEGQIHYLKAGKGEPLLLLHQSPMSSVEWEEIIPILSQHFTVYAPDMVGHGQSYNPQREFFIEDFTATTLKFMDELSIESAFIGGNHSGAALATSIAVHFPQRVKKLIISCEMLATNEQITQFLAAIKSKPLSRHIPMDKEGKFIADAWLRYAFLVAPCSSLDKRYKPFIHGQTARLKPYDIHESVLHWMAKDDWMARLQCPTLVFGAEKDLFFSDDKLAAITQRFAHFDSHVIRDAGALSTFEQPEAVANMMRSFFKPA